LTRRPLLKALGTSSLLRGWSQPRTNPHVDLCVIGQIDHGKTTLTAAIIKALSKRSPKNAFRSFASIHNAPEVKLHNITLAVSRVEYETANRQYTHADCPGHTDYVKGLITGAVRIDGAILVVAATDGPMPETREQLRLARQLGVSHIVVALNKIDSVKDPALVRLVEVEIRELLATYGFDGGDMPVVKVSALGALNGDPKWEKAIDDLLAAVDKNIPTPARAPDPPFLMPIEDYSSVFLGGTIVTGRIETGVCKVGEEMELVGLRDTKRTVVAGIEISGKKSNEGRTGDKVRLLLRDVRTADVQIGQVISKPDSIKPYKKFRAEIYRFSEKEGGRRTPVFNGYRPEFSFRTTGVTGVARLPASTKMVVAGGNGQMEIELIAPVAMDKGLRFAIRENGFTMGVGVVTDLIREVANRVP
jgi:elongation factor Tu